MEPARLRDILERAREIYQLISVNIISMIIKEPVEYKDDRITKFIPQEKDYFGFLQEDFGQVCQKIISLVETVEGITEEEVRITLNEIISEIDFWVEKIEQGELNHILREFEIYYQTAEYIKEDESLAEKMKIYYQRLKTRLTNARG